MTLVRNIVIILIGTHLLAFFLCLVYGNVKYIIRFGDGGAELSLRRYEAPYHLFFDDSGSIYTVIIGIMAAGITLFSQTGMPMSSNSIVSSLQFKYFDIMSFVFNCLAALFGAILIQASVASWNANPPVDAFGTSLIGAIVLWVVCSLMAPANSAVRAARSADRSQLVDQLERYRQAMQVAARHLGAPVRGALVWGYPSIGIALAAIIITLSRTDLFRVDGGTASLSWIWIIMVALTGLVSILLGFVLMELFSEVRVSWMSEGFQGKILSVAIFSYILFAIVFSVVLIGVSVLASAVTLAGGLAILFYLAIFGVFPVLCSFAFAGYERRYWRSVHAKLNRRFEGVERDLRVVDKLTGSGHGDACMGYL